MAAMEFISDRAQPDLVPFLGILYRRGIVLSGYTDESRSAFGKMTIAGEVRREPQVH